MIDRAGFISGLAAALKFSGLLEIHGPEDERFDFEAVLFRYPTEDRLEIIATDCASMIVIGYDATHFVVPGTRFVMSVKRASKALDIVKEWEGELVSLMPYRDSLIFSSDGNVHQDKRKRGGRYPEPAGILAAGEMVGSKPLVCAKRVKAAIAALVKLTGGENFTICPQGTHAPLVLTCAAADTASSIREVSCYIMPHKLD